MKTFYTIFSVIINPVSSEKISLGLLLSNGHTSFVGHSKNRLSLIRSLIDKESYSLVKQYLQSINAVIKEIDINQDQHTIFEQEGKNLIVNESYINYLSDYSRNVISFSKPVTIDLPVEQEIFNKLFVRFIEEESIPEIRQERSIESIRSKFLPRMSDYFLTEQDITPKRFSALLLPVSIDMIGKNDQYVIGHFMDLERNPNHIKSDYFDFKQLADILLNSANFLITTEPEKAKWPTQHHFWKEIRNLSNIHHVDISEVDIVEAYAREHQVKPIIQEDGLAI